MSQRSKCPANKIPGCEDRKPTASISVTVSDITRPSLLPVLKNWTDRICKFNRYHSWFLFHKLPLFKTDILITDNCEAINPTENIIVPRTIASMASGLMPLQWSAIRIPHPMPTRTKNTAKGRKTRMGLNRTTIFRISKIVSKAVLILIVLFPVCLGWTVIGFYINKFRNNYDKMANANDTILAQV